MKEEKKTKILESLEKALEANKNEKDTDLRYWRNRVLRGLIRGLK